MDAVPAGAMSSHEPGYSQRSTDRRLSEIGTGFVDFGEKKRFSFLQFAGNWPFGPALTLFVSAENNLAFMSGGGAVYIMDISDPAHLTELSTILTRGQCSDHGTRNLFYENGRLYIADAGVGLLIYDVSTPSNPVKLGTARSAVPAKAVVVHGPYAYVATGAAGLRIIDVSNPAAPQDVGILDTPGNAMGVVVQFPLAYVADGSKGLRIIDVSSPSTPFEVSSVTSMSFARNVSVHGDHAYLVNDANSDGGMYIVDVSNPSLPVVEGMFPCKGDISAVECDTFDVSVQGNLAYVVDFHLFVVDVSDPSAPYQIGAKNIPGWGFNVVADGDHVYTAGDMGGLSTVDVSVPADPQVIGQFRTPGWSWDVALHGDYAFMADDLSGLFVLDISDPSNPVQVAHKDSADWTMGVEIQGDYAYVAARTKGLRVLDISSPVAPEEVGHALTDYRAYSLAVKGNRAYTSDMSNVMQVVDISDPTAPFLAGTWNLDTIETGTNGQNIAVEEPLVYVAHRHFGVRIIDASDPGNMVEVGSIATPAYDVEIRNGVAYVGGTDGLHIVDVSDPANPVGIAELSTPGQIRSIELRNSYAFLGLQKALIVVDVSVPASPVVVDTVSSLFYGGKTEYFWAVETTDTHVYVANGNVGLQVYDIQPTALLPIPYAVHQIVIDGICDPLIEWRGAQVRDISLTGTPVVLYLAVNQDENALYVGLDDRGNTQLELEVDVSTIYFDEDNDDAWPVEEGQEGGFVLYMNEAGPVTEFRSMSLEGSPENKATGRKEGKLTAPGVTAMMSENSGNVQAEWRIDLNESALNPGLQHTIGLYIDIADSGETIGALPGGGQYTDPGTFQDAWLGCPDADEDGFLDAMCGGDDCNDGDRLINPEAIEDQSSGNCSDGADNDCDGLTDEEDPGCATPPNPFTLSVQTTGSGTVTSDPEGIDCGMDCAHDYEDGTPVTLTASPEQGWVFTGWGEACAGTGDCVVNMVADQFVTAAFTHSSVVFRDGFESGDTSAWSAAVR